jgi:hypothetical protein
MDLKIRVNMVEMELRDEQYVFRGHKSTVDLIFAVMQILEI